LTKHKKWDILIIVIELFYNKKDKMNTEAKNKLVQNRLREAKILNQKAYGILISFVIVLACMVEIINEWFIKDVMNPNFPEIYGGIYCGLAVLVVIGGIIHLSFKKRLQRLEAERRLLVSRI
jgi:hypothetical protein